MKSPSVETSRDSSFNVSVGCYGGGDVDVNMVGLTGVRPLPCFPDKLSRSDRGVRGSSVIYLYLNQGDGTLGGGG